jgi:altronate hydrolase
MYQHMEDDMDVNCGTVVDGSETVAQVGARIFQLIVETASGQRSKSEQLGFGEDEFAPWVLGATM